MSWPGSQKQRGMTLVELLVSTAVGVMLITGIIQLMASNKQHYQFQSELARVQENGRYALSVIREDLQMAGVSGCAANAGINNLLDTTAASYTDTLFNLGQAVGGWEYIAAGSTTAPGDSNTISTIESSVPTDWHNGAASNSDLHGTLDNKIFKASDVLVVKSTEPALDLTNATAFTFPTTTTSFSIDGYLDSDDGSSDEGWIVVISDCVGADLFQNCSTTPGLVQRNGCALLAPPISPANSASGFGHQYEVLQGGEDATISAISVNVYYVGAGQDNAPTLYRKDYSTGVPSNAEPLVEGVESMQVLYGVDTSSDSVPNKYVTAAGLTGTNADNVVSVRISLLLRSIGEIEEVDSSDSLLMAEALINSGPDRYLRKTVSTTVQLRNRGI
ncbi:MAG: PilW family protein [Pseudomonadales bacterium]|nr:PilW family protein [Pseudomonadales bacterium]